MRNRPGVDSLPAVPPFPSKQPSLSDRLGAVQGAKRTLDGEDRFGILAGKGKGGGCGLLPGRRLTNGLPLRVLSIRMGLVFDLMISTVVVAPTASGEFSAGKRDLYQCCGGHSVLARLFRLSRSFALGTGLLSSLRSCPVLGRDFVNPSHPRAIEKCGGGREGEYYMA